LQGFAQPTDEAEVYVGIVIQDQVPSCDQTIFPVSVLFIEIMHNQDGNSANEVVGLIPPDQGPGG